MADALEAAMPAILSPDKSDDDFGRFIHAVPGILAVRHGLDQHRDRALDLLEAATQRFSMEFYIRPFLNRWPEETLERLRAWVEHDHYHVRRLVSEGTRPRLPWATNIALDPMVPLSLLDRLHADPTRYVTRSVANHMNDLSKLAPDRVVSVLSGWQSTAQQNPKELDWMTRHALRTAVKRGEPGALRLLGYDPDVSLQVAASVGPDPVRIGDGFTLDIDILSDRDVSAMVDYRILFYRPNGRSGERVFKLKAVKVKAGRAVKLSKFHKLKSNASTFTLHPGQHGVAVQINGVDRAHVDFDLVR
jgi:3-methyladenine DNA glycosylase AlkC